MSREEALNDWLPIIRQMVKGTEVYVEALEMAIKALQQEPCEDCISRESVNNLVRELGNILNGTENKRDVSTVLTDILYLPSVTPQQKPNIKALGEDIRICQKSITDKKVLIGFNMAVAICNKHLAESEVQDADSD